MVDLPMWRFFSLRLHGSPDNVTAKELNLVTSPRTQLSHVVLPKAARRLAYLVALPFFSLDAPYELPLN